MGKLQENFEEIYKKLIENFKWFQKNLRVLLESIEVVRNWYHWYYEEILENVSEIISAKLGKKILKKRWKNVRNPLHKLEKKKYFDRNLVKFSR